MGTKTTDVFSSVITFANGNNRTEYIMYLVITELNADVEHTFD